MSAQDQFYRKERRAARVQAELPVRYGEASLERLDRSGNISEDGLYIPTNEVLQVGARIELALEFPGRVVRHSGEVIWAIQVPEHLRDSMVYGMGIRFVEPESSWPEFFRRWKESSKAPAAEEPEAELVAELRSR